MTEKKNDEYSELFNQVNWKAVNWARERAAAETGSYKDFWTLIAEGLAENVGSREIVKKITETSYSRTEAESLVNSAIAQANSMAALAGYREAAQLGVQIKKRWLAVQDSCEMCKANEAQGAIALDANFQSGHAAPPAHLKCRCSICSNVEG